MAQKNSQTRSLEVKNFKEVFDYCYLNGIVDVNSFLDKCLKQGFDIEKYGLLGEEGKIVEKVVEVVKEVPVEKIVEIIKEVEVIKEVEKEVVKEVKVEIPVSKIEYIYDKTPTELEEKILHLESENKKFSTINTELESKLREFSTITKETTKIIQNNQEDKSFMLQETLIKLRREISEKNKKIEELQNKIKELESIKINQGAVYLKDSNLLKNL